MKFAIISDPHIGDYSYGSINKETGLNTRLLDVLRNLDFSIEYSIQHEVNVFIIVGDIYRIKHPNSKIRQQFARRIRKLVNNGIRVILLTGNHDMTTTSDGAHALSETQELCDLIEDLEVYSWPKVERIGDIELYMLPFVNRGRENLLTAEDFLNYQKTKIKEFNEQTKKSKAKYKLFFGHFGTDKSVLGNSFDLDMSSNEYENKINVSDFDDGDWTAIYLGHIHKQQNLSDIAKHVGSLSRIDFTEENEEKGFYVFEDGKDEFIKVNDTIFKTFSLRITKDDDSRECITSLINKVQSVDVSRMIVRVKSDISSTKLSSIKFDEIESYLRKNALYFSGTDINILNDEVVEEGEKITSVDLPNDALKKYVEKHVDKFKDISDKVIEYGTDILKQIKSI